MQERPTPSRRPVSSSVAFLETRSTTCCGLGSSPVSSSGAGASSPGRRSPSSSRGRLRRSAPREPQHDRVRRAKPPSPCPCHLPVEVGLHGLRTDPMHRGFLEPMQSVARRTTRTARDPLHSSITRLTWCGTRNALPPRSWQLHGLRRNWCEGRIAECPRLQQNGSSDDLSFSCKNVGSSML